MIKSNDHVFTKKILLSSVKGQEYHEDLSDKLQELKILGNLDSQEGAQAKYLHSLSKGRSVRDSRWANKIRAVGAAEDGHEPLAHARPLEVAVPAEQRWASPENKIEDSEDLGILSQGHPMLQLGGTLIGGGRKNSQKPSQNSGFNPKKLTLLKDQNESKVSRQKNLNQGSREKRQSKLKFEYDESSKVKTLLEKRGDLEGPSKVFQNQEVNRFVNYSRQKGLFNFRGLEPGGGPREPDRRLGPNSECVLRRFGPDLPNRAGVSLESRARECEGLFYFLFEGRQAE